MRVSPIIEESGNSPRNNVAALATSLSNLTITSTESGNTIRGGTTPGLVAGTPSYPLPRMHTPGYGPGSMSRSFGNISQNTSIEGFGATQDRIMRDVYKAERATLAIPANTTDIENVPWGQKATYNEHQEDDLSLGYMARGSSLIPSCAGDIGSEEAPASEDPAWTRKLSQPSLQNRHSFTAYKDNRERKGNNDRLLSSRRPTQLSRSKSYFPPGQAAEESAESLGPTLTKLALTEHSAQEQNIPN
ncbi:hypothetical protein CTA2_11042 [Colletotrichum tanaceti]|uniref:Uncharacterized protein n=1 Tax=Colletotrichum tanaceti TaxID=1306861 RepID=A0A4U6XFN5_9PEZI|nr:hypothetical protein CTA2_11042 [Colletotrichum tanaceti]TKW54680.1 hypothetical protein CTA1_1788 [Colletotrichum tanaceti]